MPEVLSKLVDLVATQPNVVIEVLVAIALLCIVATPILSLVLTAYVVRALVRREAKGGNQ